MMASQPDLQRPSDDPYSLVGDSWPQESESSYHAAEAAADDAATTATTQAQSATDAGSKMSEEKGKTAASVSGGYSSAATQLSSQGQRFTTISGWMTDAAGKVDAAKRHIRQLVRSGTSEIRDAINSETSGTAVSPSSTDLIAQYRVDIAQAASKLVTDLDSIGHYLRGDPGSSATPSYTSVPTSSTPDHPNPVAQVVGYNSGQATEVVPQQLPPMPRIPSTLNSESPIAPTTLTAATPHSVNPTLAGLISPSSSPPSASSLHTPSPATHSSPQAHQPTEQNQAPQASGIPRIPSVPLPDLTTPAAAITTAVTSSMGPALLPAAPTTPGSPIPVSAGFTPGISGAAPVSPLAPGLAPIGSVSTPPVPQSAPATTGTPPAPSAGLQVPPSPPNPAPRGPIADAAWIQQRYGLAPGIELTNHETTDIPARFIADLPEPKVTLHKILATLRQAFESAGWDQPLAVAAITRGLENRSVFVTADAASIWPSGVLLPQGVVPMGDMPGMPADLSLAGSLMVSGKLRDLTPSGWKVEAVLTTVPGDDGQTAEQYQELEESGETLPCTVSRGDSAVTAEEAMSVFARAALGSQGCGDLGTESARIKAARWVGTQPADYLDALARWHLAEASDAMSLGHWADAVYASEKYVQLTRPKTQAA